RPKVALNSTIRSAASCDGDDGRELISTASGMPRIETDTFTTVQYSARIGLAVPETPEQCDKFRFFPHYGEVGIARRAKLQVGLRACHAKMPCRIGFPSGARVQGREAVVNAADVRIVLVVVTHGEREHALVLARRFFFMSRHPRQNPGKVDERQDQ